jgi:hypothetical protein
MSERNTIEARHFGAVVLIAILLGLTRASAAPKQNPSADLGPSYFLDLLEKEGAAGIESRMYVAPPDLMTPLLRGIASGAPEWLDVYARFRRGLVPDNATSNYIDDALAQALGRSAAEVLALLHRETKISAAEICRRTGLMDDVLEPADLLSITRRQQNVSKLQSPNLERERSACLASLSALTRRQLRIYLASYGASDSTSKALSRLSPSDRGELESVLATARKDPTLRARGDGSYPDGPFRKAAVPSQALEYCAEGKGAVANAEGPWQYTDAVEEPGLPWVRLLNACRLGSDEWDLTCQHGGFAPYHRHVRVRRSAGKWLLVSDDGGSHRPFQGDPWADCRSLQNAPLARPPAR